MNADEEKSENTEEKSKNTGKRTNRKYKFHDGWLEMEQFGDWLVKIPEKRENYDLAFCKICNATLTAHKSDLIRHSNSAKHKKNEIKMASGMDNQTTKVKRAQIELSAFIDEHNLSFEVTDCLVPLCKNIFPDSDIASRIPSKKTKKTQIIKNAVVNDLDKLYMKLQEPGMFFSIIMNESMDQSEIKQCMLNVVFMDEENGVRHTFFDMFELKSGPAKNLYSSLKNSIKSKGIPLENLVGFSLDTTKVMMEENNPVFAHLQHDCPDIAWIKYSCHMMHLAASNACLKLPNHVEYLLRNLGSHFSSNYGSQLSFTECQEFFHVEIHTLLSQETTRWLSVKKCVGLVLEQYDPLQEYIRQKCMEDTHSLTLQTMLDTMNNPFTKVYLTFMSYILGILCEFNKMFQADKPLMHKLKPEVEKLLKDICSNFIYIHYVRKTPVFEIKYTDTRYFLPLSEIYLGVSASETINDLKHTTDVEEKETAEFFESILNFYVELITVVREKFDFEDEIYNIISIVDPQVAQDYHIKSLVDVWKRFPVLKKFINIQALDNEWKKHALLEHSLKGLDPSMPADVYWLKVFKIKNAIGEPAFPNLFTVMKLLLAISSSNTSFERSLAY